MTTTIHISPDGMGCLPNPYSPYDPTHEPGTDYSRFDYFSKNNPAYPVFDSKGNRVMGRSGEVQAELVWQLGGVEGVKDAIDGWLDAHKGYYPVYKTFASFQVEFPNVRAIYRLIEKKESPNSEQIRNDKEERNDNHFYLTTESGVTAHVNMNPNADKETVDAVKKMIDLAHKMPSKQQEPKVEQQVGEVTVEVIKLAEKIFYSPATNGQANDSIMNGARLITEYATLQTAALKERVAELEKALQFVVDNEHYETTFTIINSCLKALNTTK